VSGTAQFNLLSQCLRVNAPLVVLQTHNLEALAKMRNDAVHDRAENDISAAEKLSILVLNAIPTRPEGEKYNGFEVCGFKRRHNPSRPRQENRECRAHKSSDEAQKGLMNGGAAPAVGYDSFRRGARV
jgi:hypothetical protein